MSDDFDNVLAERRRACLRHGLDPNTTSLVKLNTKMLDDGYIPAPSTSITPADSPKVPKEEMTAGMKRRRNSRWIVWSLFDLIGAWK
jgi:hypothetical protein